MHRGGVEQVELGPVGEHQRHRVAAAQAELVQPGGDLAHALGVLAPGDLDLAALGAQRDLVGTGGRGRLEGGADGLLAPSSLDGRITRR